jgi:hypothetical protein
MPYIEKLRFYYKRMRIIICKRSEARKRVTAQTASIFLLSCAVLLACSLFIPATGIAGLYLDSAHGSSSFGVKRSAGGFPDYTRGLCAHCHEQHASYNGTEPDPAGGAPSKYLLFDDNSISQTENICFECHKDLNSFQTGGSIINRSYSYRAGGWTTDTLDDILESFSFVSPDISHDLPDISTFITGTWGYTADSNPCAACHNPHAAQGDPANAPNSSKSAGTRGWPVSRPSTHSTDNTVWALWGDGVGEKMSDYTAGYQAPYRFNSTTLFEPDGSTTETGTNLTDYVTFCTDCHNDTNTIASTQLGRNVYTFSWDTAKHGKGTAGDGCPDILPPYQSGLCGGYVLSCTDCHEPHGSPNIFLIRKLVNSTVVTVDTGTGTGPDGRDNKEWVFLCGNCHDGLNADGYHTHPVFIPPDVSGCSASACHFPVIGDEYRPCGDCHFHGNDTIDGTGYGEQLF